MCQESEQMYWGTLGPPTSGRVRLKRDDTRWRTDGEVKGKLANGVGSQYSSHYLGTWCIQIWCDFDRASSLICGNKMPSRCNRGFYCRSYCLHNMFRAPLYPSSGAQEYYTVVAACGISYCGFEVAGLLRSWGLCVRFAGCCSILQNRTHNPQLLTRPATWKITAPITTGSNHCIILLSSWWWA